MAGTKVIRSGRVMDYVRELEEGAVKLQNAMWELDGAGQLEPLSRAIMRTKVEVMQNVANEMRGKFE